MWLFENPLGLGDREVMSALERPHANTMIFAHTSPSLAAISMLLEQEMQSMHSVGVEFESLVITSYGSKTEKGVDAESQGNQIIVLYEVVSLAGQVSMQ